MDQNVYAPPAALVMDAPRPAPEFYVVSRNKFLVLFFITLGVYQLYWFYMHWARYRTYNRQRLWPAARAIFAIFFAHALGGEIDQSLRRRGAAHRWSPGRWATGYVVFQIAGSICDRLSVAEIGSPTTDVLGLLAMLPVAACLMQIQMAANSACGQPEGESNRRFTWANWLWIAVGTVAWTLVLLGLGSAMGSTQQSN